MRTALRPRSAEDFRFAQIHPGCKPESKLDRNRRGCRVAEIGQSAASLTPTDRHRSRPTTRLRNLEGHRAGKKIGRIARSRVRQKVFGRDVEPVAPPARAKS